MHYWGRKHSGEFFSDFDQIGLVWKRVLINSRSTNVLDDDNNSAGDRDDHDDHDSDHDQDDHEGDHDHHDFDHNDYDCEGE